MKIQKNQNNQNKTSMVKAMGPFRDSQTPSWIWWPRTDVLAELPLIGSGNTTNTEIHDQTLSWLNTDTSIKSGGVKLIIWAQLPSCSEIMRSIKCYPQVTTMPTPTHDRENWAVIKNAIILNIIHNTFNLRDKDVVINVSY